MEVSKKSVSKFTPMINAVTSKPAVKKLKPMVKKEVKRTRTTYKIPKTPKVSGLGWGG